MVARTFEKSVREGLRRRSVDLKNNSADLKESLTRLIYDLSKPPRQPTPIAPYNTMLNRMRMTYNDIVSQLYSLEIEVTGLAAGSSVESGLDKELRRTPLMETCRKQREKAVQLERYIRDAERLIEAAMSPGARSMWF